MLNSTSNLSRYCAGEFPAIVVAKNNYFLIFGIVVIIIEIFLTGPLNLLVVMAITKTPSLHTPSNVLLCNLALTDLGTGLLTLPCNLVLSTSFLVNSCLNGVQKIGVILHGFFSGMSFITLTLISLDRVLALKFHLRYSSVVTIRRIITILVSIWLVMLILSLLYFWIGLGPMEWVFAIVVALCLLISCLNNLTILQILRRHKVAIDHQQSQVQANVNMAQKRKNTMTTLWIYLTFVLCSVPSIIIALLVDLNPKTGKINPASFTMLAVANIVTSSNSLLNPLLYCFRMRSIRVQIARLLPMKLRTFFSIQQD